MRDRWRWQRERFVTIKIHSTRRSRSRNWANEVDIGRHIYRVNPSHKGWHFVRHLKDEFTIANGHQCLVFEPLREPLWLFKRRWADEVIPSFMLKIMLQMILHALDYLHSDCHIIHTDLKPDNMMIQLETPAILDDTVQDEVERPLPQKQCPDGRTIYLARNDYGPPQRITGLTSITDFDMAVYGDVPQQGCIQAEIYRAPEVILDAGFSYSADIWSLGVLLWDLLEHEPLFATAERHMDSHRVHEFDEKKHLAYITALLGHPPAALLRKGKRTKMFYDCHFNLRQPAHIPANFSFHSSRTTIHGEDKDMFIKFVQRMLKWQPEDRATAQELLKDEWLYADFDELGQARP